MPPKKQKKSPRAALQKPKRAAPKKRARATVKITKVHKKDILKQEQQPLCVAVQAEQISFEHPPVSHLALSGHRSRFEHTWIVVGCFSLMFASLLFLSSQIKAAQDSGGGGLQAAQVSASVLPNPYNTKQKSFFEKWYGNLDPTTKLSLQSGLVLLLLTLISTLLLVKKHPKNISHELPSPTL